MVFGYIRPLVPELRVADYETYRAAYCGLCRALSLRYSFACRALVNYDATLALLIYEGLRSEAPSFKKRRCPFNPFKNSWHIEPCGGSQFAGDLSVELAGSRLEDNIRDCPAVKSLLYRALLIMSLPSLRRAGINNPGLHSALATLSSEQEAAERNGPLSVDAACDPTARALSGVFELMSPDGEQRPALSRLGYMLGRFVYLCDAVDDLSDDMDTGGANPLIGVDRADFRDILYLTIGEAEAAFDLLTLHNFKPLLENIVHLGLKSAADRLTAGGETVR